MINKIKNLFKKQPAGSQMSRVTNVMIDGQWHSLESLVKKCGGTQASISARVRDLRKARYGGHTVLSFVQAGDGVKK